MKRARSGTRDYGPLRQRRWATWPTTPRGSERAADYIEEHTMEGAA